jgi:hypothetical protein
MLKLNKIYIKFMKWEKKLEFVMSFLGWWKVKRI